ncbi:glycine cleavage H-protein-domain-containing protein [Lipomyces oligophaga]|uniref:glycine cleavage H-protein-domain-containing protein n=1 Tax=Lipomyces oligophaga TaxID=45792 RepID=UPI0034CD5FCB
MVFRIPGRGIRQLVRGAAGRSLSSRLVYAGARRSLISCNAFPPSANIQGKVGIYRKYTTDREKAEDFPAGLKYTEEHEWLAIEEGSIGVIGVTSYASRSLGDVVYVELPAVGTKILAGETIGAVESVKSASDIYSPVSGEIVEVNESLEKKPGLINQAPYQGGWLCKIKMTTSSEVELLMDSKKYEAYLSTGE